MTVPKARRATIITADKKGASSAAAVGGGLTKEPRAMSFEKLLRSYEAVVAENKKLKAENKALRARLGILEMPPVVGETGDRPSETVILTPAEQATSEPAVSNLSAVADKVRLFMSLFRGRDDVYAKRWEGKRDNRSGYSPVCLNEWKTGICSKPRGTCAHCGHKAYGAFDQGAVTKHLLGEMVAGVYPMLADETCWFLAIDFDKGEWQKDVSALRDVCHEANIPVAVERSRSGNGSHVWFFFDRPVPASLARRLGTSLLTRATSKRHDIAFASYDRFFPCQDTMPAGGLGNLIALPLQKEARNCGNSEFVDEQLVPYPDQWAFLASVGRLSEDDAKSLASTLCQGHELGVLKPDEEEASKPWETVKTTLSKKDFPREMAVVKANMLFVPKPGISERALNRLKRLAVFKNPEFYKYQAMRMPTFGKSRIICCAEDTTEYLCLPRGCQEELESVLTGHDVELTWIDKTNSGRKIDVEFNGQLRDEQPVAMERLLAHDTGLLSGTTAFGKTVVAIKLIAERKVNTLIVVDKATLISQWKNKLAEFLSINETLPEPQSSEKKRGRKKARSVIGQLGQGKDNLSGIIDIALMQSLNRKGDVKDCVKDYGLIIVDECHHVAAFSFEEILKTAAARYVYGLTATPARNDGHHPIIFMQCGPIRYRDDARKQAEKRPFDHLVTPRFTSFRAPMGRDEKEMSVQEHYSAMVADEQRNQQIVGDVLKSYENRRNCLVLTERTAHVRLLAAILKKRIPEVFTLVGGRGTREAGEILRQIAETPADRQLVLVATGKYVGEGFDEPRLDTLFLTMPISWKGTLQQYAGRLHRLFENKKEVQVYDYVDAHVSMLAKMYQKRLNGYASIGYQGKGEGIQGESVDLIYDKGTFLPVFKDDLLAARRDVIIVSPFVAQKRTLMMIEQLQVALGNQVKVTVVTRPVEDYGAKGTPASQATIDLLQSAGVSLVFRSGIHQKFAIIDERIVWYGSINLLSFGSAEESIMRLQSTNVAFELMKTVEREPPRQ
jgi:superfamily II DNA or RNA helicase